MTEATQDGPGKGKAFFERAHTVADSGNYDYAIDMYIQGLNRDPQNVEEHEGLRKVSLHRKVKGGKAASGLFGAKTPFKGKSPKEQMLNAEWLLAKDPGNIPHMLTVVRQAAAAGYPEVVRWMAMIVAQANKSKPSQKIYLELVDVYEKLDTVPDLKRALDALQSAIDMTPNDMNLGARGKDLAAKVTLKEGGFEAKEGFKQSIKDIEQTKALLQEENLAKSEDYKLKQVDQAQADYEKNPHEMQVITKYVKALYDTDREELENRAIEVLQKAFAETKVYRYKVTIGDIKMKQMKRHFRPLADALKAAPNDKALQQKVQEFQKERLVFELGEFKERAENFPTDMQILFEYGRRLYQARRFEEAIATLQIAQNNPRHRAEALHLLGRSFLEQNMKPEAVETLKRAIEEYEYAETGDHTTKEFHYWLAHTYEDLGKLSEAVAIYSKITQWDIGFRDSRTRLQALRAKLEGK